MSEYTPTTVEMRAFYTAERLDGPHLGGFPPPTVEQAEAEFDRWLAAHDAEVRASVVAEEPEALTEKDLYDLPAWSIVMRGWNGMDPDLYQKHGDGWWIELTNSRGFDGERLSLGVVWSDAARFTPVWVPVEQRGEDR